MTKINYTEDQVSLIKKLYSELGNKGLKEIAEKINKSIPSVRAKLIREGVYIPDNKISKKSDGPSKKELLNTLQEILGFDTTGFSNATKPVLQQLIEKFG